ncbi:FtsX-like permease family protein [uncultured Vagococcus sp.]|uniref:ABC transporter permease n=1 Tax=uncultured Vagococcus sp. TaxID=189676 RepID=UPI0028D4309E|nr:FtsX-like permease family protein [uncultured Vagococcus sp.]
MEVVSGDFVFLEAEDPVWQIALKADFRLLEQQTKEDDKEAAKALVDDYYAPILVADDAFLKEFETYVLENQLSIDLESFKNGTGIVANGFADFSPKMKLTAEEIIGEQVNLANYQKEAVGQMVFSGYYEPDTDDYPTLHVGFGLGAPNLMISEKGMANLGLKPRAFKTEIYVEPEAEPESKKMVKRWVSQKESALKPSQREIMLPWVLINSEWLENAQDEIRTIKIVMYAVSLLMVILGLVNFFNTIMMTIISRKRELAILESIGMTRKQLRRLLIIEGVYYSLIVGGLLSKVGVLSLKMVYKVLKSQIGYATYQFPAMPFVLILFLLIGFCVIIPLLSYKKVTEESIVERLQNHNE